MKNLYIATYSAHASILESLAKDGVIKKLLIDAGGLKMPYGSFSEPNLFNNYSAVTGKTTLHAKIILKDYGNDAVVSLWTGNLRCSTKEDSNLFFNLNISEKWKKELIKWFNCDKKRKSLFFYADKLGENVKTILPLPPKACFWNELSKSMPNKEKIQHIYAFSPWGSRKFIDELLKKTNNISLYTRRERGVWADYALYKNNVEADVYKAKVGAPFPHFKAIFVTDKNKKLIWSYVGSANFTEAAMFKGENIEYGLIFPSEKSNRAITDLFNRLKNKKFGWELIQPLEKYSNKDSGENSDENYDDYSEYCNVKNFQERKMAHVLLSDKRFTESFLENIYSNEKTPNIKGFHITVDDADDYRFHLVIKGKDGAQWEIDVPRIKTKSHMIFSDAKIDKYFTDILKRPKNEGLNSREKSNRHDTSSKKTDDNNILIRMNDLMTNKEYLTKVKNALDNLEKGRESIKDKKKYEHILKLLDVWKPVVDKIGV